MKKIVLNVDGIKCEGCVNRINNVLLEMKKLISYNISLEEKTITLEVKNDNIIKEVISKIENLGFKITNK